MFVKIHSLGINYLEMKTIHQLEKVKIADQNFKIRGENDHPVNISICWLQGKKNLKHLFCYVFRSLEYGYLYCKSTVSKRCRENTV